MQNKITIKEWLKLIKQDKDNNILAILINNNQDNINKKY